MSVSKRETAKTAILSTDPQGSIRNEMAEREKIAVSAWQHAHMQSSSGAFDVSESESPYECPQQSWAAHALPPPIIRPTTARRSATLIILTHRRNMAPGFSQISRKEVKNPVPVLPMNRRLPTPPELPRACASEPRCMPKEANSFRQQPKPRPASNTPRSTPGSGRWRSRSR